MFRWIICTCLAELGSHQQTVISLIDNDDDDDDDSDYCNTVDSRLKHRTTKTFI